jgi:hypothetical protein
MEMSASVKFFYEATPTNFLKGCRPNMQVKQTNNASLDV